MNRFKISTVIFICVLLSATCLLGCEERERNDTVDLTEQGDGTTLRIYYGVSMENPMKESISRDFFTETGIQIEWEAAEEGLSALKAKFAANEVPDIFSCGGLMNLEQWKEWIYPLNSETWVDIVLPEALENEKGQDGTVYGMPVSMDAIGIIYNKDVFQRAGIEELPQTFTELERICCLLQDKGIRSFGECYSHYGPQTLGILFAYQEDGLTTLEQGILSGELSFRDFSYTDEWFQFIDLTVKYGMGELSIIYDIADQVTDFINGEIAMIKQGNYFENIIISRKPDMDIGLFAIPLIEQASGNKLMVSFPNTLCVYKYSSHLDEALIFLDWIQKMQRSIFWK